VVIGGAFGIGLATARRFAAEGANVVIADLDDEQAAVLDLAGPDAVLLGTPTADSSHWGRSHSQRSLQTIASARSVCGW
jgi:NAD(P)-dependent dehydrogenase (short-subunit alcohol dehydrogenase family)